jgi:hypothetical protein
VGQTYLNNCPLGCILQCHGNDVIIDLAKILSLLWLIHIQVEYSTVAKFGVFCNIGKKAEWRFGEFNDVTD